MSTARPDTWMPLYWGDYLRDTGHLGATEHGAYLLLIGHYWTTGKPLPDDDVLLARIARMPPKLWKTTRHLIAPFFQLIDGEWRHKRITLELAKWERIVAAKANAGRTSAAAKAQRRVQQTVNTCSTDVATEHPTKFNPENSSPSPSPSPSPSQERKKDSPAPNGAGEPLASDLEMEFDLWWIDYPRKQDRGHALKAFKRVRKSGLALETLTTATRKYAVERAGQDAQYTKLGATWLNGQCWLDESSTDIAEREREQFKRDIEERMQDATA